MCGSSAQAPVRFGAGNPLTFNNNQFKTEPHGVIVGCGCSRGLDGQDSTETAQRIQERFQALEDKVQELQSSYKPCNCVRRPRQQWQQTSQ